MWKKKRSREADAATLFATEATYTIDGHMQGALAGELARRHRDRD